MRTILVCLVATRTGSIESAGLQLGPSEVNIMELDLSSDSVGVLLRYRGHICKGR